MSYGTVQAEKMTTESGYSLGAGNASSFKNRLINGGMVIDQRNAGAAVNLITAGGVGYCADRWFSENTTSGTATVQQVADAPAGFSNSIRWTVTATASSLASTDSGFFQQRIEGFNSADLSFGTASAKSITVSFWVKSSVTGTFGGALANNAYDRGYSFTYTISAANTWEYKTVTITGDTTGTWVGATNGVGIRLTFAVAAGSARGSTPGSWGSFVGIGASGQTNLMATNGATWQITGVQFEVGTVATSFDYRSYGTELDLCCRYYYKNVAFSTYSPIGVGRAWSGTQGNAPFFLPVPMRANQTVTYSALTDFDIVTLGNPSAIGNDGSSMNAIKIGWTRGSGVVSGNLYQIEYGNTTSAWLAFSAEL